MTYIQPPHVKQESQWETVVQLRELSPMLCDDLDEQMGAERVYVYLGSFTLLYGRSQHNIVKQLFSN